MGVCCCWLPFRRDDCDAHDSEQEAFLSLCCQSPLVVIRTSLQDSGYCSVCMYDWRRIVSLEALPKSQSKSVHIPRSVNARTTCLRALSRSYQRSYVPGPSTTFLARVCALNALSRLTPAGGWLYTFFCGFRDLRCTPRRHTVLYRFLPETMGVHVKQLRQWNVLSCG